jgi:hypothetical protein
VSFIVDNAASVNSRERRSNKLLVFGSADSRQRRDTGNGLDRQMYDVRWERRCMSQPTLSLAHLASSSPPPANPLFEFDNAEILDACGCGWLTVTFECGASASGIRNCPLPLFIKATEPIDTP